MKFIREFLWWTWRATVNPFSDRPGDEPGTTGWWKGLRMSWQDIVWFAKDSSA